MLAYLNLPDALEELHELRSDLWNSYFDSLPVDDGSLLILSYAMLNI
jgi:hypothetical protein